MIFIRLSNSLVFPDLEPPIINILYPNINILYRLSGICGQFRYVRNNYFSCCFILLHLKENVRNFVFTKCFYKLF